MYYFTIQRLWRGMNFHLLIFVVYGINIYKIFVPYNIFLFLVDYLVVSFADVNYMDLEMPPKAVIVLSYIRYFWEFLKASSKVFISSLPGTMCVRACCQINFLWKNVWKMPLEDIYWSCSLLIFVWFYGSLCMAQIFCSPLENFCKEPSWSTTLVGGTVFPYLRRNFFR